MARWYCPIEDVECPYYNYMDGGCLMEYPNEDCDDYISCDFDED